MTLRYRVAFAVVALALAGRRAEAQQPLAEFLAAARHGGSTEARVAAAQAAQARSLRNEARGRLLPSLLVTAGYTRNQQDVVVTIPSGPTTSTRATITPLDQLDARFSLTLPLLDLAAWSNYFGASSSAEAARERSNATVLDVTANVVTAYYAVVESRAVRDSAAAALGTAEENASVVGARADAGRASVVDRERANADVARAQQTLAEATLQCEQAAESLYVASGVRPTEVRVTLADDLAGEAPLETWTARVADLPSVRAAAQDVRAAENARVAALEGLVPTLAATATERITNASGFGPADLWSVGVSANWSLDFVRPAAVNTRSEELAVARARADGARRLAESAVLDAWNRVRSLLVRARAARAGEEAATRAAESARARLGAGTGSHLELSQAERDRFVAEVTRIQAEAELIVARLALRVRSGSPDPESWGRR